ncbi:DUF4283 domain-containing protein [Cephalotus follicularis]|uniref:DUF4283 domain-containing protein n=1 Tax=Cephalotus follicularis TaxID=3775 RepID=A0A1Q3DJH2_CEPFO|nr:DUF4283 domain-containing protein [Cephalotus follicularis]
MPLPSESLQSWSSSFGNEVCGFAEKVDAVCPPVLGRKDKGKAPLVEDSLSEANFPGLEGNASADTPLLPAPSPSRQWRQLFQQANRVEDRLSFHAPKNENGVCIVEPPDEVFEEGVRTWSNTLVGYFVGKRIPLKIVKENLEKKWRKWGSVQVIAGVDGYFLFRFSNSTSCDLVLSNGPWEVWGAYLALRRWEEGMSLCKESFSSIPVWVKLSNVPAKLWTRSGLSYIASALGVPLCMDAATAAGNRLSFARVCVEMKANSSFPHSFKVRRRSGIVADIQVQYVWKPSACSVCKVFDHSSEQCHLVDSKANPDAAISNAQVLQGAGAVSGVMAQDQTCPQEFTKIDELQVVQDEHLEATRALVQAGDQSGRDKCPAVESYNTNEGQAVQPIDRKNDPTTPLKPCNKAAAPTSSDSLDPNPPDAPFRYIDGSGKKRKKKREAARRGTTPFR